MTKYKLVPYDEINDIWLLRRQWWWIFYSHVGAGSKAKMTQFVKDNNGVLV